MRTWFSWFYKIIDQDKTQSFSCSEYRGSFSFSGNYGNDVSRFNYYIHSHYKLLKIISWRYITWEKPRALLACSSRKEKFEKWRPLEAGPACIEGMYTIGTQRGTQTGLRWTSFREESSVPIPLSFPVLRARSPRNNKNGLAGDLRILASRVAPVASLVTPHARNTMLCYSNGLEREK